MDEVFIWIGAILGLFLVLMYVVAPIMVKLSVAFSPELLEELDPSGADAEVREFWEESTRVLSLRGFAPAGHLAMSDAKARTRTLILVLTNPAERTGAAAAAIYARTGAKGQLQFRMAYLEFSTEYEDGTVVDTGNSPEIPSFASVTGKDALQVPSVRDPDRLCDIHRARIAAIERPRRYEYDRLGVLDVMKRSMEKEMAPQVEAGHFSRRGGVYRPTWKGAFLMTWGLVPPIGWLRRLRMRRRAEDALGRAGLDSPTA